VTSCPIFVDDRHSGAGSASIDFSRSHQRSARQTIGTSPTARFPAISSVTNESNDASSAGSYLSRSLLRCFHYSDCSSTTSRWIIPQKTTHRMRALRSSESRTLIGISLSQRAAFAHRRAPGGKEMRSLRSVILRHCHKSTMTATGGVSLSIFDCKTVGFIMIATGRFLSIAFLRHI
jgi:hypothetical protein